MARTEEIYAALAQLAPVELAESWDNVGLLVNGGREVSRVLVTLDITRAVVEEAAAAGCELIVSHHPVIFGGLKRLDERDVAWHLVRHGISAVCMHTNLDAADGGVNDVLAGLFALQEPQPFAGGCGRVGSIAPVSARALARQARQTLRTAVRLADAGRPVRRLAIISGAGGSMFEEAAALGADCLLTGEANHHQALDAVRLGMSVIAAGHFATEWPVVPVLAEKLRAAFPGVPVRTSTAAQDPFDYLGTPLPGGGEEIPVVF